ncbi:MULTISPECIES: Rrf2 family transcriptional regulator [Clostridia]|uniref:RrF2 family transcriptional regulator n=1 Tax=Clostridia TaxID=186801 RepID=UPI00067F262B|nr:MULTISPECIES: Rrf2 family transcriptional regulator [Clostridia]
MKMSTKGQYALEIVADLALHSGRDHLESLKNIAERRKLSEKYLERIVKALKEKGIVKSVRGAYGGYCLEKEAEELTVLEVLTAVEGELAPVHCLTRESNCGIDCGLCPTRNTWEEMWKTMNDAVGRVTIADIVRVVKGEEAPSGL